MAMEGNMSRAAIALNDAVIERDLPAARTVIAGQQGRLSAGRVVLEAICHLDRTAEDRDWEWLAMNLE